MRNLTITRRKSFVASVMKDQVYIRDEQAQEFTIAGVPCRKIGTIKNGESKTFQIEDGEQQIFLIADKISKDYCYATVTVSEGQEDVSLSGIHKFVFGTNPFCFDGVQLTEEQLVKQKKNSRKGAIIMILSIIIGFALGYSLTGGLFKSGAASPRTFEKEDFKITLTDVFEPVEHDGFFTFYQSNTALVFTIREDQSLFSDITLEEYVNLVLESNGKTEMQLNRADEFVWFAYTDIPEGEEEIYYLVACYKSDKAFWIVNFATPVNNQDRYKGTFLDWAKTIEFDT